MLLFHNHGRVATWIISERTKMARNGTEERVGQKLCIRPTLREYRTPTLIVMFTTPGLWCLVDNLRGFSFVALAAASCCLFLSQLDILNPGVTDHNGLVDGLDIVQEGIFGSCQTQKISPPPPRSLIQSFLMIVRSCIPRVAHPPSFLRKRSS